MADLRHPALDPIVEAELARARIPGLSVAVCRSGATLHAAGYGFANLEHRAPAAAETVYHTASLGKQFTAALFLLLSERGVIHLDDPVAPHFPEAPPSWAGIAVRHLLTHTSGLNDEDYDRLNLRLDYTDTELVAAIASAPPLAPPGAAWSYSNAGYVLLGILAARLTGRFYADLLHQWLFQPLGMNSTRAVSEAEIVPGRAAGYVEREGALRNQEYVSPSLNRLADGGLYTSVLDLALWDRALHTGAILSAAAREQMWTPVRLTDGREYPYGFGWEIASTPYGRLAQHDGAWLGYSSHMLRYLDEGLSVAILANCAGAPATELAHALAEAARRL